MVPVDLYSLLGALLFGIGLHGVAFLRHLLRRVIAMNIMGTGVFLILVATARRGPGPDPDPLPHAMVLTGVVVAISATALALALIRRLHREYGLVELPTPGAEGRRSVATPGEPGQAPPGAEGGGGGE